MHLAPSLATPLAKIRIKEIDLVNTSCANFEGQRQPTIRSPISSSADQKLQNLSEWERTKKGIAHLKSNLCLPTWLVVFLCPIHHLYWKTYHPTHAKFFSFVDFCTVVSFLVQTSLTEMEFYINAILIHVKIIVPVKQVLSFLYLK